MTSHLNLFFWELPAEQIRYLVLGAPPGLLLATFFTPGLHMRFGKRNSLIGSVVGTCLTIAGPVVLRLIGWFPENGEPALFPMLAVAKGISYCVSAVMLISIVSTLADVTDEHELLTGRRQEGVFFAARSFFGKLTSGLGHLLAGLAMDVIRFPTGATPGEIPVDVIFDFGLLAGPLTVLPAFVSVWFYWRYDIDQTRHAEIRHELDRRAAAADPRTA